MRLNANNILPATLIGKIVAVFGYITAAFGVYCAIGYFIGPLEGCKATDISQIVTVSRQAAVVQLLVVVITVVIIRLLQKEHSSWYRVFALLVLVFISLAQLVFAMGFAFGVGTACTT